jgi:hypothetical protein
MLGDPTGRGQCTAWAELLVIVLEAQGQSATNTRVDPGAGFSLIAVKAMPAQGTGGANYVPGTLAAGGFNFHQVVRVAAYPDRVYDPSYGTVTIKTDARTVERKFQDMNITNLLDAATGVWVAEDPTVSQLIFTP